MSAENKTGAYPTSTMTKVPKLLRPVKIPLLVSGTYPKDHSQSKIEFSGSIPSSWDSASVFGVSCLTSKDVKCPPTFSKEGLSFLNRFFVEIRLPGNTLLLAAPLAAFPRPNYLITKQQRDEKINEIWKKFRECARKSDSPEDFYSPIIQEFRLLEDMERSIFYEDRRSYLPTNLGSACHKIKKDQKIDFILSLLDTNDPDAAVKVVLPMPVLPEDLIIAFSVECLAWVEL